MRSNPTYIKRSSGKAIFSSKMFLSSKNQRKIRAAFEDDENIELIQQLDEYLGDEYIRLKKPKKDDADREDLDTELKSKKNDSENDANDSGNAVDTGIKAIRPSKQADDTEQDTSESDTDTNTDTNTDTDKSDESEDSDKIENSTAIKSTTIIMHPEYEDAVNEIKGFLNANSTTAGVSRVRKKDDEIWIYYKDSVNLNNIMDTVIELLSVDGYLWMIFNRLARSENAIVFAILEDDTLKNLPSPPTSHDV